MRTRLARRASMLGVVVLLSASLSVAPAAAGHTSDSWCTPTTESGCVWASISVTGDTITAKGSTYSWYLGNIHVEKTIYQNGVRRWHDYNDCGPLASSCPLTATTLSQCGPGTWTNTVRGYRVGGSQAATVSVSDLVF